MSIASKWLMSRFAAKSEKTAAKKIAANAAARGVSPVKRRTAKEIMSAVPEELESYAAQRAKRKAAATVNIGLEPSTKVGGGSISKTRALKALRGTGRRPLNVKVVTSGSEPTLVADVKPPLSAAEMSALSAQLRQDAIAQRLPAQGEEAGLLAGPRAQDWGGEFNPAYFYLQGGDTLGASLMTDQFRAGAPVADIRALADKWGISLDPVNLAVHSRLRDEAVARGAPVPEQIGQFTGRASSRDPDALQAYQEAQRRLRERSIAEKYLEGRRTPADIELFNRTLGELPPEDELRRIVMQTEIPAIGGNPELQSVNARGVHIGRTGGLEQLDPSFYGQGHRGAEYASTQRRGLPSRTYYYSGPEGTIVPEPEVLGMSRFGGEEMTSPRYAYEADLTGLYDINQDPEQLVRTAQALNVPFYKPQLPAWAVENELMGSIGLEGGPAIPDMERWIKDRGYSGYLSDFGGGRAAAVYEPWSVRALRNRPVEPGEKFAVGGRV